MIPSYTFEGSKLTIYKHQSIYIPVIALHKDPNIYPNPNVFDPTRFTTENNSYNDGSYLPFGRGPRNCIGKRIKVVLYMDKKKIRLTRVIQSLPLRRRKICGVSSDNWIGNNIT